MKDESIAIILYANIDHYPSSIYTVKLLENNYKVVIFSKNTDEQVELIGRNTVLYKFGSYSSVTESEKARVIEVDWIYSFHVEGCISFMET